jgi:hypothetical protein
MSNKREKEDSKPINDALYLDASYIYKKQLFKARHSGLYL